MSPPPDGAFIRTPRIVEQIGRTYSLQSLKESLVWFKGTVRCRYVNFHQNPFKRHPIARPSEQDLWISLLTLFSPQSLLYHMQKHVMLDRVIMALDYIRYKTGLKLPKPFHCWHLIVLFLCISWNILTLAPYICRSVLVSLRLLPKLFGSFQQYRGGLDTHTVTM